MTVTKKKGAAQVEMAKKAAARVAEADKPTLRFPPESPYYSRQQVLELVPVSYACLWDWIRRGNFPPAREIGPGGRRCRIGWMKSEVDTWIADRPQRVLKSAVA